MNWTQVCSLPLDTKVTRWPSGWIKCTTKDANGVPTAWENNSGQSYSPNSKDRTCVTWATA